MSISIRSLTVEDSRKMVSLVKRFASDTNNAWIKNIVKQPTEAGDKAKRDDEDESGVVGFVSDLLIQIIDYFQDDATEWFASLCGITVDEYLKLPIDADFDVVDQIKKQPEAERFFSKACAAFKNQMIISNITTKLKERFGSLTA